MAIATIRFTGIAILTSVYLHLDVYKRQAQALSAYICDYAMIWRYDEKSKKYCVSLRSRKGGKDVQEIAKKYGGGGHINAAGFESTNMQFLELPNSS